MSDYYYLHALSQRCRASSRATLPDDIYLTPCGGTKNVGYIASLFLSQEVMLLDGDDAGRTRRDAVLKELYCGHGPAVLMLTDVLGQEDCEVEDILARQFCCLPLKRA